MSNGPLPSPVPTPIEAFAASVVALLKLLFMRTHPLEILYVLFNQRLCAIQDRIADIAARFEAGKLRAPAPPAAPPAPRPSRKPAGPRNASPFPRRAGWYAELFGELITTDHGSLIDLIQTPKMQALMAASPQVVAMFREVLRACGQLEEARAFLPPSRSQRRREHRAATASATASTEPAATARTEPSAPVTPEFVADPPIVLAGAAIISVLALISLSSWPDLPDPCAQPCAPPSPNAPHHVDASRTRASRPGITPAMTGRTWEPTSISLR